jgi:hypothetical protein
MSDPDHDKSDLFLARETINLADDIAAVIREREPSQEVILAALTRMLAITLVTFFKTDDDQVGVWQELLDAVKEDALKSAERFARLPSQAGRGINPNSPE